MIFLKYQVNSKLSSLCLASENAIILAAEGNREKKVCKPIGDPVGGRDAPKKAKPKDMHLHADLITRGTKVDVLDQSQKSRSIRKLSEPQNREHGFISVTGLKLCNFNICIYSFNFYSPR